MTTDLSNAKALLEGGSYTCVLCRETEALTSGQRGIAPLLDWIEEGRRFPGWSAADKVVGKAAAFLYVLLGVRAVYAPVLSRPAKETLEGFGVTVLFDQLIPAVRNRAGDGFCPMEQTVWEMNDPHEALSALRKKRLELRNNR